MEKIIKLRNEIAFEATWGDGTLAKRYHCQIKDGVDINKTTDAGGFVPDSIVDSGEYQGKTLEWLFENHPEYFGGKDKLRWKESLPVAIMPNWASDYVSYQVHPTEEYANRVLNGHAKQENWYIPECDEDATIDIGHKAKTLEELDEYIEKGQYEDLMIHRPLKPGSFFRVKPGVLHAIHPRTYFIMMFNYFSATYRLYDYGRKKADGTLKPMQIPQVKENILIPHVDDDPVPVETIYDGVKQTVLSSDDFVCSILYNVAGQGTIPMIRPYLGCFVIKGEGKINGEEIKAGDSFMITAESKEFILEGDMEVIAAS